MVCFNTGCFLAINSAGLEEWQIIDTYIRLLTSFTKGIIIINPFFARRLSCFLSEGKLQKRQKRLMEGQWGDMRFPYVNIHVGMLLLPTLGLCTAYPLHLEKKPTQCVASRRRCQDCQVTLLSLFLPGLIDQQPAATGEFRATRKMADTWLVTNWYNGNDVDWSTKILNLKI